MIKGNLGTISVKEDLGLIADEKFFVESFPLPDGENWRAGTILTWNTNKTKLTSLVNYTEEPVAVLCENIKKTTNGMLARCLVFGRVNLNALFVVGESVANATPENKRTLIESLRKVGIYATEGER